MTLLTLFDLLRFTDLSMAFSWTIPSFSPVLTLPFPPLLPLPRPGKGGQPALFDTETLRGRERAPKKAFLGPLSTFHYLGQDLKPQFKDRVMLGLGTVEAMATGQVWGRT